MVANLITLILFAAFAVAAFGWGVGIGHLIRGIVNRQTNI